MPPVRISWPGRFLAWSMAAPSRFAAAWSITAPMKVSCSVGSPTCIWPIGLGQPCLEAVPQAARDVGAGGGGALLALELERAAHQRHQHRVDVGGGMDDDGVLAAGLPHDPRIAAVALDVRGGLLPQLAEDRGGAGERHPGELLVLQRAVGHRRARRRAPG